MKDRNRRMLGGLNGYLKKAESRLKQEVSKVSGDLCIGQGKNGN